MCRPVDRSVDKIGLQASHTMHPSHALKFIGTFVGIFFLSVQGIQYPCGFLTYLRFLSKHQRPESRRLTPHQKPARSWA